MPFYSTPRPADAAIILAKPTKECPPALTAYNALPGIKAASSFDTMCFGLNAMERVGSIVMDETVIAALTVISETMNKATSVPTIVPKDADKETVEAMNARIAKAAKNAKSPLQQVQAGLVEVQKA